MDSQRPSCAISGLSGRFPESDSLESFWKNLIDGTDVITADSRRWNIVAYPEAPFAGKVPNIERFDAQYFLVSEQQANGMDPRLRILLEVTHEAFLDAGHNPTSVSGTNCGVFVASTTDDAFYLLLSSTEKPRRYHMTGSERTMLANRISYAFNLRGVSSVVDTACSSGLVALNYALLSISAGMCDCAVVAGASINLFPPVSQALCDLKVVSQTGRTKTFDAGCDGYVRSEAVVAIIVSPQDVALRSYAIIAGLKSSSDGFKSEGICFPSSEAQENLLRELYADSHVHPLDVAYIEVHGTGTNIGDSQELKAIASVFCDGRQEPLLVGSVKSNIGHTEAVAGLCGIAKVILSNLAGVFPPNLHFQTPNPKCSALLEGKIRVVTSKMAFKGNYVGINSFGFGGTNSHIILKFGGDDVVVCKHMNPDEIPRIVLISGRTSAAVQHFLLGAEKLSNSPEFLGLVNNISRHVTPRYPYRGFFIAESSSPKTHINLAHGKGRLLWYIFNGVGQHWPGMTRCMMKFKQFRSSIHDIGQITAKFGFDLHPALESDDMAVLSEVANYLMSLTAMQIAIVNILQSVGVHPDRLLSASWGEMACAYTDGCINLDQCVQAVIAVSRAFVDSRNQKGVLAAVKITWEEAKKRCPRDVFPGVHNSIEDVTVVGKPDSVHAFIHELQSENIFAKVVDQIGFPYHSPLMKQSVPFLLGYLRLTISNEASNERSTKWLSSSFPQGDNLAGRFTAEYITRFICQPVYVYDAITSVPEESTVVEIGSHAYLQPILLKTLSTNSVILGCCNRKSESNVLDFLRLLGQLYLSGVHVNITTLYNPVAFPVSQRTPPISPLVHWDHSSSWDVPNIQNVSSGDGFRFSLSSSDLEFLSDHAVKGQVTFPAVGFLWIVWKAFARKKSVLPENLGLTFENVSFKERKQLTAKLDFHVTISETGQFVVTEKDQLVCNGAVKELIIHPQKMKSPFPSAHGNSGENILSKEEFYKALQIRGYRLSGLFQGVSNIDLNGYSAELEWKDNWLCFLDAMVQTALFKANSTEISILVSLEQAIFDPKTFFEELDEESENISLIYTKHLDITRCNGFEFRGLSWSTRKMHEVHRDRKIAEQTFIPYFNGSGHHLSRNEALQFFIGIAIENCRSDKFIVTEMFSNPQAEFVDLTCSVVGSYEPVEHRVVVPDTPANQVKYQNINVIHSLTELINQRASDIICTDTQENISYYDSLIVDGGFLAILAHTGPKTQLSSSKYVKVSEKGLGCNTISLYHKCTALTMEPQKCITVSLDSLEFAWVDDLKSILTCAKREQMIIALSTNVNSGIIGFIKSLTKDYGRQNLRCFFMDSLCNSTCDVQTFHKSDLVAAQIKHDIVFNVHQFGRWGCYGYKYVPLEVFGKPLQYMRAYADARSVGDLSSIRWIGSQSNDCHSLHTSIHYSAINFKDILYGLGKIPTSYFPEEMQRQGCFLGMEFSGRTQHKRICGLSTESCLATDLENEPAMYWKIPNEWTLANAATIPAAYTTVLYALLLRGGLIEGESVLIHSGSGGVGLAAIFIALSMGCDVFVTVGSNNKAKFLKSEFPTLDDSRVIVGRRSSLFENQILVATNGIGVDAILVASSDETLLASIRCLAENGRLIEIGKSEALNRTPIGLSLILKNKSMLGINIGSVLNNRKHRDPLKLKIKNCIGTRRIKPIPFKCFHHSQLEIAFRYMAGAKHVGKIIVRIQAALEPQSIHADPRTYFFPRKTYIVIGGLGGMGLELVDWMIERRARNVFIVSRSEVTTSYQQLLLERWHKQGAQLHLEHTDISSKLEIRKLLEKALSIGPIGGIFNLALVSQLERFVNMSAVHFQNVNECKGTATANLDELSREYAPNLDHFVVYSSLASGIGAPDRSSYAYANSAMERICEQRKIQGLPALAVQWGPVGDVGTVANLFGPNKYLGNFIPQPIKSCMETLDVFLQKPLTVACSYIASGSGQCQSTDSDTTLESALAHILGLSDLTAVKSNAKLSEIGMDSLMAVEIRSMFYLKKKIVMPVMDYGKLTISGLMELAGNLQLEIK